MFSETWSPSKMCRMPYHRTHGMFGKSTRSGQVQIELQRRRCAAVQGTQNSQTPLDAQTDAERQVFAMRKGQCSYISAID